MEAPRWFAMSFWVLLAVLSSHAPSHATLSSWMSWKHFHEYKSALMKSRWVQILNMSWWRFKLAERILQEDVVQIAKWSMLSLYSHPLSSAMSTTTAKCIRGNHQDNPSQVRHVPMIFMSCNPWETINLSKSLGNSPTTMMWSVKRANQSQ